MIYGKRNKLEKQKANIYKGTIAHYGCDAAACNNNFMDLPSSGNHWALEELARQIVNDGYEKPMFFISHV